MILIVERGVLRQTRFEVVLDLVIVGLVADPAVAGEHAVGVGVDDKRRQTRPRRAKSRRPFPARCRSRRAVPRAASTHSRETSPRANRRTARQLVAADSAAAGPSPGSSRPGESTRPIRSRAARTVCRGSITPASRRFSIARSTFRQAVFCTSTAPTITSNGDSPGHQCCGPNAASNFSYTSRNMHVHRSACSRARPTVRQIAARADQLAAQKSSRNSPTNFFLFRPTFVAFLQREYNDLSSTRHEPSASDFTSLSERSFAASDMPAVMPNSICPVSRRRAIQDGAMPGSCRCTPFRIE